eukprot:Phypoly_transcript_06423.p1 GENE.Phypoly_transcript_06423~~Phypoly_transcript_06423.p1  ORF type:complete len:231 (+),score=18.74 Phypoly_transcript_06423:168-860(+)
MKRILIPSSCMQDTPQDKGKKREHVQCAPPEPLSVHGNETGSKKPNLKPSTSTIAIIPTTSTTPITATTTIPAKHYEWKTIEEDITSLLHTPSIKERERSKVGNELVELLERQSVKEKSLVEKFKSKGGPKVTEYCPHGTREECNHECAKLLIPLCDKIHFRRIIKAHTDISLGDCSYLDTCRHMKTCKFVHYEIDDSTDSGSTSKQSPIPHSKHPTSQPSLTDSSATYV